jgi:serine/threonine-protein kinase
MSSPPTTLGQYQIIREIARSNDIVYEAYDPLMNRRVAVKELAMPGGATPQQKDERISRFRREAQAAGTLNHPNIMTVFSFAEDAGRTFMAMEYLDGCTLRNEIDTKGFLPVERAVEIATAVLEGLGHAHSKGVIHRDIKPDNIQILSNGTIKITDFGIARLTFQPNLTMDGQVFGTPSYMSPEQVVGKDIDARSDLFSVGVLLYEMLSGQKPFPGDSVVSITYAIMNKEPVQPTQIMSWALWEVVRKSLDKTPGMRYASAADMIQALKDAVRPTGNVPVVDPMAVNPSPGYGSMPTVGAPNTTPYQPYSQPVPPPPVYQYDPYSQGQTPGYSQQPYQPQGAAYGQGSYVPPPYTPTPYQQGYSAQPYMPPPAQVPVYYPPPPRQPLLKPETVAFLKRLGLTVLIVGTFLGLIAVAVGAIISAANSMAAEREDQKLVKQAVSEDRRIPVEERIEAMEQHKAKLRSATRINEANRNLAVLYEELGDKYLKANDLARAESHFLKALELDRHNPALFTNLGQVYAQRAQAEQAPSLRADLWKQAGEQWQLAASQETDTGRRSSYKEQTAIMFYNYAAEINSTGDTLLRSDARNALYEAQANAPVGSELEQRIRELLTSLS